jgi:hypothetical protein
MNSKINKLKQGPKYSPKYSPNTDQISGKLGVLARCATNTGDKGFTNCTDNKLEDVGIEGD